MVKTSKFHQIISILMIFIVQLQFTGCMYTKVISGSELSVSKNYAYVIACGDSIYNIENPKIVEGIFSGIKGESSSNEKIYKIFVPSDSVLKINDENMISFPTDKIVKVYWHKTDGIATSLVIATVATGLYIIFKPSDHISFTIK